MIREIAPIDSASPVAAPWMIPDTTARTSSPSTSSITAAPRMMRAKPERSAPASFRTRAVMPTLVAAGMAPRNACSIHDSSGRASFPTPKPRTIGVTTPRRATRAAGPPTASISLGVDSRPTWKSRADVSGPPRSAAFPIAMPTSSSPRTAATAARAGKADVAVGNILGSCVFNTLGVAGVAALVGEVRATPDLLSLPLPVFAASALLFYLLTLDKRVSRWEGIIFVLLYVLFVLESSRLT
jgi:hypothetical protein